MEKRKRKNRLEEVIALIATLSKEDKKKILFCIKESKDIIPISAFNAELSCLEIVIKYLKEEDKKTSKEISALLNRKLSTVYTTYNNSKLKYKKKLDLSDNSVSIPTYIFQNRKFSVLESVAAFLKDNESLSLKEISLHLNRNYNTIKTVYARYKKKLIEQIN